MVPWLEKVERVVWIVSCSSRGGAVARNLPFELPTDTPLSVHACLYVGRLEHNAVGDGWNTTLWGQATYSVHGATVPLYDTLGPDTVSYVINQTELTTVVVGAKVRGAVSITAKVVECGAHGPGW